jgi:DNA-binding LytR/AlgR family response regulator
MKLLIVEDELLIAEMLKEMLQDLGYSIAGIAKNYAQAIALLQSHSDIDLCFLDINLQAEQSGFDVASFINEQSHIPFVFLTSYSDRKTIAEAANFKPQSYLLKPFTETDLFATLEIIKARKSGQITNQAVTIKDGTSTVKIPLQEIKYLKSENIYVEVKTNAKTYLVRNSLSRFLEELSLDALVRVHRTYAVNMYHVKAISGDSLLVGDEKIPLSRMHRDMLIQKFHT